MVVGTPVAFVSATRQARMIAREGPDPYDEGGPWPPLAVFIGALVWWPLWLVAWLVYRAVLWANDALVRAAGADRIASERELARLEKEVVVDD